MVLLAFAETSAVQLVPDGTIFIHIALILLMIWVLQKTFFRPINRIIEAREKNKGGHSVEADKLLKEVSEKETKYSAALRDARSKGYSLIEKERTKALTKKQEKIGAAKDEVHQTLIEETEELEKQTVEARQAIATEAEKMAEKISSNILRA
jgi:F-type H+-transporting ATPase subunit b